MVAQRSSATKKNDSPKTVVEELATLNDTSKLIKEAMKNAALYVGDAGSNPGPVLLLLLLCFFFKKKSFLKNFKIFKFHFFFLFFFQIKYNFPIVIIFFILFYDQKKNILSIQFNLLRTALTLVRLARNGVSDSHANRKRNKREGEAFDHDSALRVGSASQVDQFRRCDLLAPRDALFASLILNHVCYMILFCFCILIIKNFFFIYRM